jgi:hypothetical protein
LIAALLILSNSKFKNTKVANGLNITNIEVKKAKLEEAETLAVSKCRWDTFNTDEIANIV